MGVQDALDAYGRACGNLRDVRVGWRVQLKELERSLRVVALVPVHAVEHECVKMHVESQSTDRCS